jgi:GTP-binding protein YchF
MECGIVGLPNVGKSTLFNALVETMQAEASNYPFCTIEPNVGVVAVPDARLMALAKRDGSAKIVPTQLKFVDIAGLVRGASRGEGLGNQFLSHIRQVDANIQVVRCFGGEVTHVAGRIDPLDDILTIETELMLADLQSIEKRLTRQKKGVDDHASLLKKAQITLEQGEFASNTQWDASETPFLSKLGLVTLKPMLYVCNVSEEDLVGTSSWVQDVQAYGASRHRSVSVICNQLEAEVAGLPLLERQDFLESMGIKETGLSCLIRSAFQALGLMTFFTVGPKEAHAWTISRGSNAYDAAGVIHTDFQKGFIRAEVTSYEDYMAYGTRAKEEGKMRVEGKEALVQDGDVMFFRFNL